MRKIGKLFKSTEAQLKELERQKYFYKTCIIYFTGFLKHPEACYHPVLGDQHTFGNSAMLLLIS